MAQSTTTVPAAPIAANTTESVIPPSSQIVTQNAAPAQQSAQPGTPSPQTTPPADSDQQPAQEVKSEQSQQDAAKDAAQAAGLDFGALQAEYNQNGGNLTPETYQDVVSKMEKIGVPKDVVDNYFNNNKAAEQLFMYQVYQETGGEEGYQQMAKWARTSLAPAEIKTFSDMAESGDAEKAMLAVKLLYGRYQQATAIGGGGIKASAGAGGSSGVFRSMSELQAAQADPRYARDPAYRQQLQQRLEASYLAGTLRG